MRDTQELPRNRLDCYILGVSEGESELRRQLTPYILIMKSEVEKSYIPQDARDALERLLQFTQGQFP